ncbi:Hypothetical predicted protein [Podarcis lilfordi]|uniref:Uncharacterized protein n=1 Tax=Podarcis lilfordi TaxID=74358 RepID=A0AA35L3F2_9SAUR|nr:Hypothetical predicted protein [Podarcis lilfordi]
MLQIPLASARESFPTIKIFLSVFSEYDVCDDNDHGKDFSLVAVLRMLMEHSLEKVNDGHLKGCPEM